MRTWTRRAVHRDRDCPGCVRASRARRPPRRRSCRTSARTRIRYDNFDWHIYKTDHFEIYYYPEIEQHLERVAGYAESAYQQISSELKHDLAFKVPLILFKTQSEFQQQNVDPGRGAGRRRAPSPSRTATAWCCRSTSRRTSSTGSSRTS